MFKISFTFFYQFSFSQLFSLVEIALPSISLCWNSFCVCKQVVRLFLLQIICATQNIAAYFCFVLISEKTKRWKEVCGLYLSEKLGKWILTKMLWPAIQKYQSIVGYCSLETANSCNCDLMMRADQRENKVLKGSLWFISFRERRWVLTKMLRPAIQKIIRGSLSPLVICLSPLRTKALLGTVPWKRQTHAIMILWSMRVDQRENKALKGSLWFISFRETGEVDPDQNAVTGYSKDNSRKPKSPGELSQFFIFLQLRNNHSDLAVVKEFFLHSLNWLKPRKHLRRI